MNSPPRIGILGVGQRGLQHLAALWRLQEAGLAHIAALGDMHGPNLEEEKIRRFVPEYRQEQIRRYTDSDALLAEDELDALYVCLPPNRHDGEVIRAAERGTHLFVEKPMSLDLGEALAMEAAIARSGVIATVGFQQRHDAWHTAMREYLQDKRIVMATMVHTSNVENHSVKHTPTEALGGPDSRIWTAYQDWSGNTVVEAGIHQTDLMRYWCGEIETVQARYVPRHPDLIESEGDNPMAYSVTYTFANGAVGHLIMSRLARVLHQEHYMHVLWDHGHLCLEPEGPAAYFYDGPYPPSSRPASEVLRHPLKVGNRGEDTLEISRAFVTAIAQRDPRHIRSSFSDAMRSLAAVLGANVSAQRKGALVSTDELLGTPA
ncbi:MAG: Gfo/Idh/MocA family oxidoreductase [Chloroflexota bacterium]|nr:Gfo/Idh/MocA family oxidoreductase [Chloroflexota bacterium]MDE2839062.1 Gfo/Idh/MocA family oxidoreductase [Chloroflexota bacterium]MDE2931208.1 Gfo/Idh/MocA family oxidoreductase [Chloroflexota bacterium]